MKNLILLLIIVSNTSFLALAQSSFSGDLMLNQNFFIRDTVINASGFALYDDILTGGESWFNANYSHSDWKLRAGLRLDLFQNSNLHIPTVAYTAQGIGAWYLEKDVEKLTITAGHFYDQFGSGITFRAYEDRGLAIDNAIFGIKLKYQFNDNFYIKAFAGRQKNRFDLYLPVLKGLMSEYVFSIGENLTIIPGVTYINRTMDANSMNIIVNTINSYALADRFVPRTNVYSSSIYNTINYKKWSWYVEAAYKTKEAIVNNKGKLIDKDGSVLYSTLGYSGSVIGVVAQYKRTDNFILRTSPNEILNNGIFNFLPPMSQAISLRLASRYQAVTQNLSEQALQLDLFITPKDGHTLTLNMSNIASLNNHDTTFNPLYYREAYIEYENTVKDKFHYFVGFQYLNYNTEVYQFKPNYPMLISYVPFADITYNINHKLAIEVQTQYQHTQQDYGSWLYGSAQLSINQKWAFALNDMWNVIPLKTKDKIHYYSIFSSYTYNAYRFTLAYARQVEGIVCTGGVCRYEPAFSGVRLGIVSSF